MPTEQESELLHHAACPSCPSSDAFGIYDDGHGYCFRCGHYEKEADGEAKPSKAKKRPKDLIFGETSAIKSRSLSEETCQKFGYQTGKYRGGAVQIASYRDEKGNLVAQKLRTKDKDFTWLGDAGKAALFGQWIPVRSWKMVVITEGEIDAMSVSQAQDNKWPVVSVQNGANGAKKSIQKSIDWLEKFDEVVFMFDNDEPGQTAAAECALMLSPGKAKIAELPLKDASDMLVAKKQDELIRAIWNAKEYRPDGIVPGHELLDSVLNPVNMQGISYPWPCLNTKLMGLRKQELVVICAGSGMGKSTLAREIAYHLMMQGERLGYIALEESTQRTALGIVGLHLNKVLHLGAGTVERGELESAFTETVGNGRTWLYDHFGSTDSENLLAKIRYLARGFDCEWIILDHISILVSGIADGDERRIIDNTMTKLRSLVQELGIGMIVVSHLKDPDGKKGHEEGAQITLRQLRGSRSIGQLADVVFGPERDQQDPDGGNTSAIRIVKNRPIGLLGIAGNLEYNVETGRMIEIRDTTDKNPFEDDDDDEDEDF